MDIKLFEKLMFEGAPNQQPTEWLIFLETCESYLRKHNINNPIVVELGLQRNYQKKFYEQLLGARHIGININDKYCTPDIMGDTHDFETFRTLVGELNGRTINILFIDASHKYEDVKRDFFMYSQICSDIIAIHDIEKGRNGNDEKAMVWKFWDELKEEAFTRLIGFERYTFLSICRRSFKRAEVGCLGIGMIIKK